MTYYTCQQCGANLGPVTEEEVPHCPDHPDSPVAIVTGGDDDQ
jgi:hypothetical protein